MARFLIILGLAILVMGLLWPYLSRIGLGRLPGDIFIERENFSFYFPLMTSIVVSLVLSAALWSSPGDLGDGLRAPQSLVSRSSPCAML